MTTITQAAAIRRLLYDLPPRFVATRAAPLLYLPSEVPKKIDLTQSNLRVFQLYEPPSHIHSTHRRSVGHHEAPVKTPRHRSFPRTHTHVYPHT